MKGGTVHPTTQNLKQKPCHIVYGIWWCDWQGLVHEMLTQKVNNSSYYVLCFSVAKQDWQIICFQETNCSNQWLMPIGCLYHFLQFKYNEDEKGKVNGIFSLDGFLYIKKNGFCLVTNINKSWNCRLLMFI